MKLTRDQAEDAYDLYLDMANVRTTTNFKRTRGWQIMIFWRSYNHLRERSSD